jgi:O-antigen ligase
MLVAAHPQMGIWVAVIGLPFYFQHKELHLVDTTWVIAPAYAALFCLLPTLATRVLALLRLTTRQRDSKPHPNPPQFGERTESSSTQQRYASEIGEKPESLSARRRLPPQTGEGWGGIMLAWPIISVLPIVNVWHWSAYGRGLLELVVAPLLLYLAVRTLVTHPVQRQRLMAALFAGGGLVAVIGLVDWWRGGGTAVDGVLRLVGPYFSPNHTALYLERTLFIGLGLVFAAQSGQRRGWLCLTGIVAVALLLTASRGAWLLGIPVGIGVFAWLAYRRIGGQRLDKAGRKWPIRPPLWVIATLALTVFLVVLSMPSLWHRLANSATVANRWLIWQTTLRLWQDDPLFGVGPGGFFWRYPAYLTQASSEPNILHPHNVWLEVGALWGVAGLLWLGLLFVMVIRRAQHLRQETNEADFWLSAALVAGLAAGFAHAQVDSFTTLADLAAWNWAALGLLVEKKRILSA